MTTTSNDVRQNSPFALAQKIIKELKGYRQTALCRVEDVDNLMRSLHAIICTARDQEKELIAAMPRDEKVLLDALRDLWTAQLEKRLIALLGPTEQDVCVTFMNGQFHLFHARQVKRLAKAETLTKLIDEAEEKILVDKATAALRRQTS